MINRIIHFSVYHRVFVLILTAVIAVFGLYSYKNLPIDAVPDITNNQVQINTVVGGLIPEEIERAITFPIENAMSGVAGVEQVRSITRFGLSQVTVVFDDSVEIYRARQLVAERLSSVSSSLPEMARPKDGPKKSPYGCRSGHHDPHSAVGKSPRRFDNGIGYSALTIGDVHFDAIFRNLWKPDEPRCFGFRNHRRWCSHRPR